MAITSLFTSAKFIEVMPPKLLNFYQLNRWIGSPEETAEFEYRILQAADFVIQPPTEETYIEYAMVCMNLGKCLKSFIVNYIKAALLTNCLRKYNPRLAVLIAIKCVLKKWGGVAQSVLSNILETLQVDEKQLLATEGLFLKDLNPLLSYFSENQIEFTYAFLDG